ncbi:hypothetical protein CHU92_08955 [Flavobacterium cyanobacteriorum]|uniref:SbsA Ig-like domain-containing protein n=1 Tax=Flavobacterium cyanobacteriorum TaxID=2022802 RepID=A0A255Z7Z3_9FLAO|nr:Ig-like domain-containing protein [Flavobacterium cyanobacteriorum]OYQ37014.1 hypothetical protein CHU92_08955 [Flavobacterium cyanobacteriorum]
MPKLKIVLYLLLVVAASAGCAKRGVITGGPKDTIAPVIVRSNPENRSTNFNGRDIRIDFSEYIRIKDLNKQLIISPPMENQPDIMPMSNASRYITIRIKDTLKPNTTYSFNFGQSITDNNEGNPYSQFKFVFSTGAYIDSLSLKGKIKDAYSNKTDNFVTLMLYEANEQFNDSTIYRQKPRYVTNTLGSLTTFTLENLKEGKYHLIALKDRNNNYRYDPKTEKIAFLNSTVTVPNDTIFLLEMFREQGTFRAFKPTLASSGRMLMGFEGDAREAKAVVKKGQDVIASLTTAMGQKDSLQLWLPRNMKADSLQVSLSHKKFEKDFFVKMKEMKTIDSLIVDASPKGSIGFREKFSVTTSTPVVSIDEAKISIRDKDSVAVKYTTVHNQFEQRIDFDFPKGEEQRYDITFLPGAFKDFYGAVNDTLNYSLTTRLLTDYGNLSITLENAKRFPLLLEITNAKGEVKASYYTEKETQVNFEALPPDKYTLRVIYDDNRNGEWDSGNYLEKRQPEEVIYFPEEVDVHANWDVEQPFNIGG